jgi:hypothetical protein
LFAGAFFLGMVEFGICRAFEKSVSFGVVFLWCDCGELRG